MDEIAPLVKKTMKDNRSYSDKLKDPRWQKVKSQIQIRDNFTCRLCGDTESTLHVHHDEYSGNPWESDPEKLRLLCEHCHELVEFLKGEKIIPTRVFKLANITFCVMTTESFFFFMCKNGGEWNYVLYSKKAIPILIKFLQENG